jgi:hypothetical protein
MRSKLNQKKSPYSGGPSAFKRKKLCNKVNHQVLPVPQRLCTHFRTEPFHFGADLLGKMVWSYVGLTIRYMNRKKRNSFCPFCLSIQIHHENEREVGPELMLEIF